MKYRVKELAKERQLTQLELAVKAGLSISVVQRLWQNRMPENVRYNTLDAVARALDVQISDLYAEASSGDNTALRVNRPTLEAAAA